MSRTETIALLDRVQAMRGFGYDDEIATWRSEGSTAFCRGLVFDSCPYRDGERGSACWRLGWLMEAEHNQ